MRGFIAVTDRDWYRLLHEQQDRGAPFAEVNFWKPSERVAFRALRPGEPFFFRLKSPDNAIGGVALFQRFAFLPVWLAWEAFGRANGVPSLDVFEARLRTIRQRNGIVDGGELRIGCILLSQPMLFDRSEWVRLPSDWGPRTQSGAGYDLEHGEGARVWRECLERIATRRPALAADDTPFPVDRYGAPVLVRPRLGQGGFRIAVTEAYAGQCAVTTEHSLPVLEAAHIRPYADDGAHDVRNGLLLRSDVHRLYDRGYVTVTPEGRFLVSRRLKQDYGNGRAYDALHGQPIVRPLRPEDQPDPAALAWHAERRFLG